MPQEQVEVLQLMSEKDLNQEAYKQAEKELFEKKIEEVKRYILSTLEKIEEKKKEKARTEEELRILKLDLEDLRNGNFDKIEERQEKSRVAKAISQYTTSPSLTLSGATYTTFCNLAWPTVTRGTYNTANGQSFYL